jgi:hypothetical protein
LSTEVVVTEAVDPEIVPNALVGLASPGVILTRMRNVEADVRALDAEIDAQRSAVPRSFLSGWTHWREAWRRFYRENQAFAPRAWPGTMDEVEAFARRLRDWRGAARRAGVELASPEPGRPQPQRPLVQLPDLSQLAQALPRIPNPAGLLSPMLGPAATLLHPQGPLTSEFWDKVRPVAIAGAVVVGGIACLWVAANVRTALGQLEGADKVLPMLATRGMIR